jgi:SAM-dependent methyltransferase
MTPFREFHDPRLVALYDEQEPSRVDTAFYVDLAARLSASTILDIGCGTGAITCELARRGHRMTGIDPSSEMLDVARHRESGDLVQWIEGDASSLEFVAADLAILTGHVAQVISDDEMWRRTLAAIHRALRPGGRVAFESRNPAAKAWLKWTPENSFERIENTPFGAVEVWWQPLDVSDDLVRYEMHYRFSDSGEEVVSTNELRFRSEVELTEALTEAGFSVRHVFGDWDREPVHSRSPELIYVASRA